MSIEKIKIEENQKLKILIAVPIANDEAIAESFLVSLSRMDTSTFNEHYFFFTDNSNFELLEEFKSVNHNTTISTNDEVLENADKDNINIYDHFSKGFRDATIKYAIENEFNYIFFAECNVTYHPLTFRKLVSYKKDIIAALVWMVTKNNTEIPNVRKFTKLENINDKSKLSEFTTFCNNLKNRDIHKIGYFKGSFLVNVSILKQGINFDDIYNVEAADPYLNFCLRASVNNVDIYTDSTYPYVYMDIDYNFYDKMEKYLEDVSEDSTDNELEKTPSKKPTTKKKPKKSTKSKFLSKDLQDKSKESTNSNILNLFNTYAQVADSINESTKTEENNIPKIKSNENKQYQREIVRSRDINYRKLYSRSDKATQLSSIDSKSKKAINKKSDQKANIDPKELALRQMYQKKSDKFDKI